MSRKPSSPHHICKVSYQDPQTHLREKMQGYHAHAVALLFGCVHDGVLEHITGHIEWACDFIFSESRVTRCLWRTFFSTYGR
jgi:hypothetical protein